MFLLILYVIMLLIKYFSQASSILLQPLALALIQLDVCHVIFNTCCKHRNLREFNSDSYENASHPHLEPSGVMLQLVMQHTLVLQIVCFLVHLAVVKLSKKNCFFCLVPYVCDLLNLDLTIICTVTL